MPRKLSANEMEEIETQIEAYALTKIGAQALLEHVEALEEQLAECWLRLDAIARLRLPAQIRRWPVAVAVLRRHAQEVLREQEAPGHRSKAQHDTAGRN
jgi:hypothetical protein